PQAGTSTTVNSNQAAIRMLLRLRATVNLSPQPPSPKRGGGAGLQCRQPGAPQARWKPGTPPRFRGQEPSTGEARLGRAADSAGGRAPGEATPGAGERLTTDRAAVVRTP